MRRSPTLAVLVMIAGCSWGGAPSEPAVAEPVDTVTAWRLTEKPEGALDVALVAGAHVIEIAEVEGRCAPSAELPFTEVDGQKTFAALACRTPTGEPFDLALVEIMAPDGDWPLPVAFGIVSTREAGEGQILMRSMGAAPIPLGIAPIAPTVPEGSERPAAPAGAVESAAPAEGVQGAPGPAEPAPATPADGVGAAGE